MGIWGPKTESVFSSVQEEEEEEEEEEEVAYCADTQRLGSAYTV